MKTERTTKMKENLTTETTPRASEPRPRSEANDLTIIPVGFSGKVGIPEDITETNQRRAYAVGFRHGFNGTTATFYTHGTLRSLARGWHAGRAHRAEVTTAAAVIAEAIAQPDPEQDAHDLADVARN